MKILITGTSQGIGKAIAEIFLAKGHVVIGIDRQPSSIEDKAYTHYQCDIRDKEALPVIDDVEILVNNAGTQNEDDIDINLKGLIYMTERYGVQEKIKSILHVGSASAHTGAEFPEYCASKGGVLAYTKNVAMRVAMVLAFFDIHIWIQVGVFLLLCGLSFLFLRPILRTFFSRSAPTAFTVESAIGTRCTVVEKLDNLAGRGAVTVSGMEWAARTTSDEITVEAGKEVEIIAVEGVKFICREVK